MSVILYEKECCATYHWPRGGHIERNSVLVPIVSEIVEMNVHNTIRREYRHGMHSSDFRPTPTCLLILYHHVRQRQQPLPFPFPSDLIS